MTYPMITGSNEPIYMQLYRAIREDCLRGTLVSGEKITSRRSLAKELGISVNTVDSAYQQLVSEGYIEARPRSGFRVRELSVGSEVSASGQEASDTDVSLRTGAFIIRDGEVPPAESPEATRAIDFSPNGVDLSMLPMPDLKKIVRDVFSFPPEELFGSCEPEGTFALRNSLCRYLWQSRGLRCTPDRIVVGAGTDYILQFLVQLLSAAVHIESIAMENPMYNKAFQIFSGLHRKIRLIPLDSQGMDTALLRACDANIAYVTPSHQFPLGMIMPAGRRADLLSWAAESDGRYIIEDDYDSEFRYSGRPIPPLCAMHGAEKVIYVGTFSKSVAPSLRVSYLVLPNELALICKSRMSHFNTTVSVPDQLVLARFLDLGLFERHISRMKTLYRRKRDQLLRELAPFRGSLHVGGSDAGLHLLCTVRKNFSEEELVRLAADAGVRVYGVSAYYLKEPGRIIPSEATVLLGYGGLSPGEITRGVQALSGVWEL